MRKEISFGAKEDFKKEDFKKKDFKQQGFQIDGFQKEGFQKEGVKFWVSGLSLSLLSLLLVGATLTQPRPATAESLPGCSTVLLAGDLDMGAIMGRLTRQLNLTEDEQETLRPIVKEYVDKSRAIRHDPNFDEDDKQESLRQLSERIKGQIYRHILPEQRRKFVQIWDSLGDRRSTSLYAYLVRKFRLNRGQQEHIRPLVAYYEKRLKAISFDPNFDRDNKQEEIKELQENTKGKIRVYLYQSELPAFDRFWDHNVE